MKTRLFLLFFFLISLTYSQQEQKDSSQEEITYNKWSIDLGVGANKPTRNFAPNYYSGSFENISAELGARYMFNDRFGLKLNAVYNNFQEGENSLEFDTDFTHVNLDGVFNLGSVLNFRDFTERFGLLFSAGIGYGTITFSESPTLPEEDTDNLFTVNATLTPQYKITDKFAINLNLGVAGLTDIEDINVTNPDNTLDGNGLTTAPGFTGVNYRATLGFTVYLGSNEEHADWVDVSLESQYKQKAEKLEDRIANLEDDLRDTDKDGVADYLDREPNTPSGVAVDKKGVAVDDNKNGIPDDLERVLNQKFVSNETIQEMDRSSDIAKTLANNGYINVYFKFNSTQPEYYSLNAVNQIVEYMRSNPQSNAILTGYSDAIGDNQYNLKLSEDRAKRVYEILVAAGIKESRISYKGGGVDDSVDKSSEAARQLTRRVKFELR